MSPRHSEAFRNFLNGRHANLSFTIEREKQNRMSFLDIAIIREDRTFTTSVLVLPYLGSISLQTRTKLKKSLKNILNCCKLQIVFKNKTRLGNNFHFKDQIPKDLTSGVVYKFQCGLCNESYYGECIRHLNVRIGEHTGISPLTRKQVKPKSSSVADHLLLCDHSASYDDFSILTRDNSKFLLELKESLLILRDKPSLNRNITSAPLYLFDKA